MKKIIYSPLVALLLTATFGYLTWRYWSLTSVILWSIFLVFYSESRYNWKNIKIKK